jgi:hypothetical protein
MYFLANEHETPVQPIDDEEFTKLRKRRNSFFAAQKDGISEKLRRTHNRAVRSQNDNCYSLFGPPKKQGQNLFDLKQDRGVAKRTECVGETKQFNNCENTTTQEDGAATRQLYS